MSDIRPWEFDWSAIAAFIAASVALYAAWRANKIAEINLALSAELEIVKFREKWIYDLRSLMSSFIAESTTFEDDFDFQELNVMGNRILLMMNPDDADYEVLSKTIAVIILRRTRSLDPSNKVYEDSDFEQELNDTQKYSPETLRNMCHNILGREWNRVKNDINNVRVIKNVKHS